MKAVFYILMIAISFSVLPHIGFAEESGENARFIKARFLFLKGSAGDSGANEKAFDLFEDLYKAFPKNPLYRAFYGASYSLKGKYGWFPLTKLYNTENGLIHIDKALKGIKAAHDTKKIDGMPISLSTRIVAISTFLGVPSFFYRFETAKGVLSDTLESPVFQTASARIKAQVYLLAAKARITDDKHKEAREFLNLAIKIAPNSNAGKKAKAELASLVNTAKKSSAKN